MDSKDFTYWLKGFFELSDSKVLTEKQVSIIKNHLNLVFEKTTPQVEIELKDKEYLKTNQTPGSKQEEYTTTNVSNNFDSLNNKTYCENTKICSNTGDYENEKEKAAAKILKETFKKHISETELKNCSSEKTDQTYEFFANPNKEKLLEKLLSDTKKSLTIDIPKPNKISKKEMNKAREESRLIRQRLDKTTKDMESLSPEENKIRIK